MRNNSEADTVGAESWREIESFPGYRVSDLGRVQSRLRRYGAPGRWGAVSGLASEWRDLKLSSNGKGYLRVFLCREKRVFTRYVHRLALQAFVGPCPIGMEGCHENDDKNDNRLSNLRWDTHGKNVADARRNGKLPLGSERWPAKLTEAEIPKIRQLLSDGMSREEVAAKFNITPSNVSYISNGKTWRHVPEQV